MMLFMRNSGFLNAGNKVQIKAQTDKLRLFINLIWAVGDNLGICTRKKVSQFIPRVVHKLMK